jgi:uncharacterized protein YjbI with pentapeptide repeats
MAGGGFLKCNLEFVVLSDYKLGGCNFGKAKLQGANFSAASLKNTLWGEADLTNADLSNCDIEAGFFEGAKLVGGDLTDSNLAYANLTSADVTESKIINCGLYMAKLDKLTEENTDWRGSNRRHAQKEDKKRIEAEDWTTSLRI